MSDTESQAAHANKKSRRVSRDFSWLSFTFPVFVFHRFQSRLLAIILSLVIILQGLVFFVVDTTAHRSARRASDEALQLTATALQTTMVTRESSLRDKARLLSGDYAFKAVFGEGDHDTLISAFESYQRRLHADWMFLLDLHANVLADTLQAQAMQNRFAHPELISAAENSEQLESSDIVIVDGKPYQLVLVPLYAPAQVAWVGIGFEITDTLATELEKQTHTQVSLLWQDKKTPTRLLASTLSAQQRLDFLRSSDTIHESNLTQLLRLDQTEFVTLTLPLSHSGQGILVAALQRSLDEALAAYSRLRWQLLALFLISTLLAAFIVTLIAKRVTEPVNKLARGAERISAGHYDMIGDLGQHDEFGTLASTFDNMVRGLLERDRVRSLLGKVVSHAVAEELLSRRIELGGEEREVTLLFSDIRGFTTLCEGRAPSEILQLLNTYLTSMSALVDEHQGVVDKYIGDAVMALFGAPISGRDDAQRAVLTALAMTRALPPLNEQFAAAGWPPLSIGIGVHTGNAVAGNMGSETRLNYTVLGDAVNLASRLEGLCKRYGTTIIVSAATKAQCPDIAFREIDQVRVKGKTQAVCIFQAVGTHAQLDNEQKSLLAEHHNALSLYRAGQFSAALQSFEALLNKLPADPIAKLYQGRCAAFIQQPPGPGWDAIETLDEK